jgi:hypothetical protein
MRRYPDELHVTDAEVLADYMLSSMRVKLQEDCRAELICFLEREMAANDEVITIQKDSGLFLAR